MLIDLKQFLGFSFSAICAYFSPIHDMLEVVTLLFISNFLFGLISGIAVHKERFEVKKAFVCMTEAAVFICLLCGLYFLGDRLPKPNGAMQTITTVTYAFMYFYSVNVMKNVTVIFPENRLFAFIYYILTVEFINKIPYFDKFSKMEKMKNDEKVN